MTPARLWLDDIRPAPAGWEHAYTAQDAIARLARGGVVEVSLDHDLGPPEAGTGYDVASWIEEQAHAGTLAPMGWRTHTANTVGELNMRAALRSADRAWGLT